MSFCLWGEFTHILQCVWVKHYITGKGGVVKRLPVDRNIFHFILLDKMPLVNLTSSYILFSNLYIFLLYSLLMIPTHFYNSGSSLKIIKKEGKKTYYSKNLSNNKHNFGSGCLTSSMSFIKE